MEGNKGHLAGICPEDNAAGFDRFVIKPGTVGDLEWVKSSYNSVRGPIESNWEIKEGQLYLNVNIPVNTTATLFIPSVSTDGIIENGQAASLSEGVSLVGSSGNYTIFEVGSGRYRFESILPD